MIIVTVRQMLSMVMSMAIDEIAVVGVVLFCELRQALTRISLRDSVVVKGRRCADSVTLVAIDMSTSISLF